MRNAFTLIIVAGLLISFTACNKCYQCYNQCEVCRQQHPDTTLAIVVYSNVLSQQYYNLYLDSLITAGWSCHDTNSTISKTVCQGQLAKQTALFNAEAEGFACEGQ